jgi:predicted acyl esterase
MRRSRRPVVAALALLAVFGVMLPASAGQGEAPASRHLVKQVVPFEVTNPADGTVVRGTVYLPDTSSGEPVGTVLVLSPYWGNSYPPTHQQALPDGKLRSRWDWFLSAGYAFAAVNLRGTGGSGGCFNFGGKPDQSDAALVVDTLAAQPWSNGNVGMFGVSLDGWSQTMALAGGARHLKAIVPVSGVIDAWSLLTRNGAAYISAPYAYSFAAANTTTGASRGILPPDPEHLACPAYGPDTAEQVQLASNGDRTAFWEERDYRDEIAASEVPTFVVNGTKPVRLSYAGTGAEGEGHILQFEDLWEKLPKHDRRLLVGPWGHGFPRWVGLTAEQSEARFRDQVLDWFAGYLPTGADSRPSDVAEYQEDTGAERTAASWPPRAKEETLALSGASLVQGPAQPGSRTFASGVGSLGFDPELTRCTPETVVYSSPPLQRDVQLAGNFTADLSLSSSLPDGNLSVSLFAGEGSQVCPDPTAREFGRALGDLRHWERTGHGRAFPLLTPTRVQLRSHPFATTVRAGQRIVLVVSGDSSELFPDPHKPALTVHTPDSKLVLPVVDGRLTFPATSGALS